MRGKFGSEHHGWYRDAKLASRIMSPSYPVYDREGRYLGSAGFMFFHPNEGTAIPAFNYGSCDPYPEPPCHECSNRRFCGWVEMGFNLG